MKNNLKLLFTISVILFLASCQYTGKRYPDTYGNKKILKEEKNIKVGDKISDIESKLGAPARINKNKSSVSGKLYEYEYHDATRSLIYFSPISAFYTIFTTNIFNTSAKNVRATIEHDYLFLEVDKDGIIQKKDFVKDVSTQKLHQMYCSTGTSGYNSCSNALMADIIEY